MNLWRSRHANSGFHPLLPFLFHETPVRLSKTTILKMVFPSKYLTGKNVSELWAQNKCLWHLAVHLFLLLWKRNSSFPLLEKWLVAFSISRHGCQMFCHCYWMKACLMLQGASTSSGSGVWIIFSGSFIKKNSSFFTKQKFAGFPQESLETLD